MATLLDTITAAFGKYYTLQLKVYLDSQSTASNLSKVYVVGYLLNDSGWISASDREYSGHIGSATYNGTCPITIAKGDSSNKIFTSPTKSITHDSDGKKSITVDCSIPIKLTLGGSYVDTVKAVKTVTLPTIPRASSISSAGNVTVNGSNKSTVGISAKSSSFSHKVNWAIGDYSHTETVAAGETSVSYAIPVSWLNAIPDAKTGDLKITLSTYSGSTKIGSSATKTITISVPDEAAYKPTFTAAASDAAGIYAKVGVYVKGKSKLKISLTSISGKYSATIKSISILMNGTTYKPTVGSSASATSGTLSTAGTNTVTIKVTDSRGYYTTKTLEIDVKTYSNPYFSVLTISRYRMEDDGSYVKDDEGEYANVQYTAKVSSVGSNALQKVVIQYTAVKAGASSESVTLTDSTGSIYVAADTELVYNFTVTVTDKLGSVVYKKQLSTAATIMDVLKGGLAVAFGKVAELAGYLDIAWNVIFRKHVYMNNYSDEEKNFYFQNDASRRGKTYENDEVYPHKCKIYGGNGASRTGIGLYDEQNGRPVWVYDDVNNLIGSDAALKHIDFAITANTANTSDVSYSARAIPFLRLVVLHARFTTKALAAVTTLVLGTIPVSYAPCSTLCPLAIWINSSIGTCNCAAHVTTDGEIKFHSTSEISADKYVYISGVWTY